MISCMSASLKSVSRQMHGAVNRVHARAIQNTSNDVFF